MFVKCLAININENYLFYDIWKGKYTTHIIFLRKRKLIYWKLLAVNFTKPSKLKTCSIKNMDFCVLELVSQAKDGHFMYAGLGVRYINLLKMFIIGKTPGMSVRVFKKYFKTFPSYTLISIYRGESSRSTAHLTDHF